MFTVVERRTISDELALAAERWLSRHGLAEELDGSWLELVCEDGDVFTPDRLMLHLAAPPSEISAGDSVEVGRSQTVGELWPAVGAPADEVPKALALARTLERGDEGWVAACELPGPVRDLFTVEQPEAMLSVMNATRRTLNRGAMRISGDPSGRLLFTLVQGEIAAWGSADAEVPEAFAYWLDAGPASELATPLQGATRVRGGLGRLPDLIFSNEQGVEGRCPVEDEQPAPVRLPEDYFEKHARGMVEGLRVERQGGLGREALAAIADLRPGDVTFALDDDVSLLIRGGEDSADTFKLDGPGFAALGGETGSPIEVPYVVALAMYDGAAGGSVDLTVDADWGRLHRADEGIRVEWRRRS